MLWARYVGWEHTCVAESFRVCKEAAQAVTPDVFWMGELSLRWAASFGMPPMAGACSPLLAAARHHRQRRGVAAMRVILQNKAG